MPAYAIFEVETIDPELMAEYRQIVAPTLEPFGGRFLARGGRTETLEGDWNPARIVVVEFSSVERAQAWWNSDAYREPKAMRQRAGRTRAIIVEGLA